MRSHCRIDHENAKEENVEKMSPDKGSMDKQKLDSLVETDVPDLYAKPFRKEGNNSEIGPTVTYEDETTIVDNDLYHAC